MNKYIDCETLAVVDFEEEVRTKQMLCIVLCFLGICIFALLNINLYVYIFDGTDKVNSLLIDMINGVKGFLSFMSPSHMMEQINNLF